MAQAIQSQQHSVAASPAASQNHRPASVRSFASSVDTLVGDQEQQQQYRGFVSEEEYLKALREWIESKAYYESETHLQGWYGTKTKQDYLNKPSIFEERRARKRAEKLERERRQQQAAVAKMTSLPENDEAASSLEQRHRNDQQQQEQQQQQRQHQGMGGNAGSTEAGSDVLVDDGSGQGHGRPGRGLRSLRRVFSGGKREPPPP